MMTPRYDNVRPLIDDLFGAQPIGRHASPPVTPPREPEGEGSPEFEAQLIHFLAEAYVQIDPKLSIGNSILAAYLGHCLRWIEFRRWQRANTGWPAEYRDLSQPDPKIDWPPNRDLEAEYQTALAQTSQKHLRPLRDAGATARSLERIRPALIHLHLNGNGLFEPDPDSAVQAFIVPVRVEDDGWTPESSDPIATVGTGQIIDLVAFTPALRVRWATRTGLAEWLGACPPQYMDPPPVRLYRTPLDWLRGDCEGLVCLATTPNDVYRFLTRFQRLDTEDDDHATMLREILDRPPYYPEILVGGKDYGR
jgi:hypothetical protein